MQGMMEKDTRRWNLVPENGGRSMSLVQAELPHIKALILQGVATAVNKDLSSKFAKYLEKNYPLVPVTGYSIDWDRVPNSIRLRLNQMTEEETREFIYSTTLGQHRYAAIWYGRTQPCLVCELSFAAENLDLLFSSGWGARYVFGSDGRGEDAEFFFPDFVEVDIDNWLSGIRRTRSR